MAGTVLLEARPYRPFKSSEEYLYAMREDLAEWLNTLYPELMINVDNFMDRLDTGVALCKHANNVRHAAEEYLVRRQARQKSMTRSMTTGLAGPILSMGNVHYLPAAKCGTFFARDNVSNFITWCRNCLQIFEVILFETDDLILRKNEKNVILCLLEVARRGAKFGMLAPMLVQMERQIDREIAADNKAAGVASCTQTETQMITTSTGTENEEFETDSEEDDDNGAILMYGPMPQIVTNDLKSLDEMVRDLVEKCTCASQFPMIRVSEGKYRIGDTKVLIFVRILRSHVMVRVGGGWDTLSHYLDKHDPCRCRAQHRTSVAAKIFTRTNPQNNGIELHKAQVVYERSPPPSRKMSTGNAGNLQPTNGHLSSPTAGVSGARNNRSRSRSPAIRKQANGATCIAAAEQNQEKTHLSAAASPNFPRRSMSPSPRRIADMKKKQNSLDSQVSSATTTHVTSVQIPISNETENNNNNNNNNVDTTQASTQATNDGANKYENVSDNGSEISDEGYRSLGLIQSSNPKRISLHSQASNEDVDTNGRLDRTSPDMTTTASEDNTTISEIKPESPISDDVVIDPIKEMETKFAKCGIVMNDDEISVDIASATGLRKTGFSEVLYEDNPIIAARKVATTKIPKSPMLTRRKSMDNCSSIGKNSNETDVSMRRASTTYRSVRKPQQQHMQPLQKEKNTWNGRSSISPTNQNKKRPALTADTFKSPTRTASLTRNTPTRSSQQFDGRTRQRSSTRASSSVNTSPNKTNCNTPQSQLAQQLLDAAGKAKNDAQILGKIKQILSDYATKNKVNCDFDDFTATWVNNNGNLDATDAAAHSSNNNGSPLKSQSKRSSSISTSSDSNPTTSAREMSSLIVSPRRLDKGLSRIPAPIRSNTGLY